MLRDAANSVVEKSDSLAQASAESRIHCVRRMSASSSGTVLMQSNIARDFGNQSAYAAPRAVTSEELEEEVERAHVAHRQRLAAHPCLYDTQLLGACLHAPESGGRSRPEAVRGMPEVSGVILRWRPHW